MTISSTTRVAGPYAGTGSGSIFPFNFKVFDQTDLSVVTLIVASGVSTVLALTTDYTVDLNVEQDTTPGGTITLVAGPLPTGSTLTMTSAIAELQGLDLTNGGGFYPDTINAALDLLTILVQQLTLQVAGALQVPLSDSGTTLILPPAKVRAGKLLMFDSNGNLSLIPVAPGTGVPGAQASPSTVDGTNTVFAFSAAATPAPVPMVFVGGVYQTPIDDYTAPVFQTGTTWNLTFAQAPTQGPITVVLLG